MNEQVEPTPQQNLSPKTVADLTILLGQALYHARNIKLESVPRYQRSLVQQVLKLIS